MFSNRVLSLIMYTHQRGNWHLQWLPLLILLTVQDTVQKCRAPSGKRKYYLYFWYLRSLTTRIITKLKTFLKIYIVIPDRKIINIVFWNNNNLLYCLYDFTFTSVYILFKLLSKNMCNVIHTLIYEDLDYRG